MNDKHTPGPWHQSPTRLGRAFDIGSFNGSNVALVYGPEENGPDDFKANARIIAAAPDLLDALKGVIGIARAATIHSGGDHNRKRISAAESAIARAEGRALATAKGGEK